MSSAGRGFFRAGDKIVQAHRFSWFLSHGKEPGRLLVCHSCDVPSCVNPGHLWAGTQKENMQDCISKGRCYRPKGELHGSAKLSWHKVAQIRSLYQQKNITHEALHLRFGVDESVIGKIVRNKLWIIN